MKTIKKTIINIGRTCFVALMALLLNAAISSAKPVVPNGNHLKVAADTSANDLYRNIADAQKIAFQKSSLSSQREQMLDKLSKQPAENPEAFANAKEEYLYFEKARAESDKYEKAVKVLNQLMAAKTLW